MVTHLHCPAHSHFHIRMQRNGEKRKKLKEEKKMQEKEKRCSFQSPWQAVLRFWFGRPNLAGDPMRTFLS